MSKLPFLWLKGENRDIILEEINAIENSHIRAFCIESRPHPQFMEKQWWRIWSLLCKI